MAKFVELYGIFALTFLFGWLCCALCGKYLEWRKNRLWFNKDPWDR